MSPSLLPKSPNSSIRKSHNLFSGLGSFLFFPDSRPLLRCPECLSSPPPRFHSPHAVSTSLLQVRGITIEIRRHIRQPHGSEKQQTRSQDGPILRIIPTKTIAWMILNVFQHTARKVAKSFVQTTSAKDKILTSPDKRKTRKKMAEREGFEPPVPCDTLDFESSTLDHSDISPGLLWVRFYQIDLFPSSRISLQAYPPVFFGKPDCPRAKLPYV